jgi:hypothetical protein
MRARGARALGAGARAGAKGEQTRGKGARQEREHSASKTKTKSRSGERTGAEAEAKAESPAVHLGAVYCCLLHMALASLGAWSAACSRECFSASHTGDFVWRDSVTEVAVGLAL